MIKVFLYKIVSILLVAIVFANNINTLTIVGDFVINQDFIAKTLCIQKEDQQGCNGKCHLKKQLAQNNSDANSDFPAQNNERKALDIFCFFINSGLNMSSNEILLPKTSLIYKSSMIIKTSFKVETPPPIFS